MTVVVFEVSGLIRQAMERLEFLKDGRIDLDAHPYRDLERGRQHVAVFVTRNSQSVVITSLGRVLPGDRSGKSNRNLEFDSCCVLNPGVSVASNEEIYSDLIGALENREALHASRSAELLEAVSKLDEIAADEIKKLRAKMRSNAILGKAGFLLSCEQDAVAISLKSANLQAKLSNLSTWQPGSSGSNFIAGLKEVCDPELFWSCPDREVLGSQWSEASSGFSWMRVSRDASGYGPGVTLVNLGSGGDCEPAGVDLVYYNPKYGSLAVLHYSSEKSFGDYLKDIDELHSGREDPSDPRISARPTFVKFAKKSHFDASRDRFLSGTIHLAEDLRAYDLRRENGYSSRRHLSNSTFAALLGAGWLGGRAVGYEQAREVVELVLRRRRVAMVAVHSKWTSLAGAAPAEQMLF